MAKNNLSASISFVEDSKNSIDALVKKLQNFLSTKFNAQIEVSQASLNELKLINEKLVSISDVISKLNKETVKVEVDTKNVQSGETEIKGLTEAITQLKSALEDMGKGSKAAGVDDAQIQKYENFTKAISDLSKSLAELAPILRNTNFSDLASGLSEAGKQMALLSSNIANIGNNLAVNMSHGIISELNQITAAAKATGQALDETEKKKQSNASHNFTKDYSVSHAREQIERLIPLMKRLSEMSAFDSDKVSAFLDRLYKIKENLEAINKAGGKLPSSGMTTLQFLKSTEEIGGSDWRQLNQQIKNFIENQNKASRESKQAERDDQSRARSVDVLTKALERLNNAINGAGGSTKGSNLASQLQSEIQNITSMASGRADLSSILDLLRQAGEQTRQLIKDTKDLHKVETERERRGIMQTRIDTMIGNIDRTINSAHANADISSLQSAKQALEDYKKSLNDLDKNVDRSVFVKQMNEARVAITEVQKATRQLSAEDAKSAAQANRDAQQRERAIAMLGRKITELRGMENRALGFNVDPSALEGLRNLIRAMENYQSQLRNMTSGRADLTTLGQLSGQMKTETATVRDLIAEQKKLNRQTLAGGAAKRLAANASRQFEAALRQTSQAVSGQSQALSDLRSMAAQYISVWGAMNFVKQVAQVTGELELQRKSLEVIIGSAGKAGELYGQIRDLSQMSPYTFQDLLKSTRQLAAFGVQTKDIYNRMEALSNIGAGLSVDVSRLILAYGHTKSYGYLSGIQNRQFETAGIDLVGALADRYNRLAREAAGAGEAIERVSRKDVFKMISKKAISFEDVDAVLMELTQPGGRFHNMQQEQYNTIGGKLRNLRNNYNIMLSEIGQDNHGVLAFGVDTLNQLTANWEKFALVLKSILIPLAAVKVSMFALGTGATAASRKTATSIRNIALSNSTSGMPGMTKQNAQTIGARNLHAYGNSLRKAFETGQLTNRQIYRNFVLNGNLNKSYRALAASIIGYDRAQSRALAGARGFSLWGKQMKFMIGSIGTGLRRLGENMLSFFSANWFTIALTAVTYAWQKISSMKEEAADAVRSLREQGANDNREAQSVIDKYNDMYRGRGFSVYKDYSTLDNGYRWSTNRWILDDEKAFSEIDLSDDIEELKQKIQALSPVYEIDLLDIERMEEQADQFIGLIEKVESVRKANQLIEQKGGRLEGILQSTGEGILADPFIKELKDYSNAYQEVQNVLAELDDDALVRLDEDLGGRLHELVETGGQRNLSDAFMEIVKDSAQSTEALKKLEDEISDHGLSSAIKFLGNDLKELNAIFNHSMPKIGEFLHDALLDDDDDAFRDAAYLIWAKIGENIKNPAPILKQMFFEALAAQFGADRAAILLEPFILPEIQRIAKEHGTAIMKENRVDLSDEKSLGAAIDEIFADAADKININGKNLNVMGVKAVERWKGTIRTELLKMKDGKMLEEWQKLMVDQIKNKKFDVEIDADVKTKLTEDVKNSTDLKKFWSETIKKRYDDAKKFIESQSLLIKQTMRFDIGTELNFGDVRQLNSLLKKAEDLLSKTPKDSTFRPMLEQGINMLKELIGITQLADANGQDMGQEDARAKWLKAQKEKQEKAERDAKEKKRKAEQEAKDAARKAKEAADKARREQEERERKALDALQERVRVIKEAHSEYEKYRKTRDKDSAQALVMSRFADEIKKGIIKKSDISDSEHYGIALMKIGEKLNGMKWSTEALRHSAQGLGIQINKTLADIDISQLERMSKRFTDGLSEDIAELTEQWQLFDELLKSSGDWDLSDKLSGAKRDRGDAFGDQGNLNTLSGLLYSNLTNRNLADKSLVGWFLGELAKSDSPDAYFKLNDILRVRGSENRRDALTDEFKRLFDVLGWQPGADGKDENKRNRDKASALIDGISKLIEELVKTRKDEQKNSMRRVAEIYGGVNNIRTKRERILNQYTEDYALINQKGTDNNYYIEDPKERQRAVELAKARRNYDLLQLEDDYLRFFNSLDTLTRDEAQRIAKYIRERLSEAFEQGAIDAKTYAENIAKVEDMESRVAPKGGLFKPRWRPIQERVGSFWYNPSDENNKKAVSVWQGDVSHRLEEQYAKPWERQDLALIDVLKKLSELLNKIQQGTASAADKDMAGKLGQDVQNWGTYSYDQRKGVQKKANEYTPSDDTPKDNLDKIVKDIIDSLKALKDGLDYFHDFFDSLGMEGAANTVGDASTVVGGALNGAGAMGGMIDQLGQIFPSLGKLGPYGAAAGAALGLVSGIAQAGDARRQRQIEALRRDVQKVDNTLNLIKNLREKTLGYDSGQMRKVLARLYSGSDKASDKSMAEYYLRGGTQGSGYSQELESLKKQRQDYLDMYDKENGKKKKSKEDLEEYRNKVAELDIQIMDYTANLAKELWSIDLQGWASQIGDALMTAFENGTNAAAAFRDSVQDIMRSVVKSMMIKGIIEPVFEKLQNKLFGENGVFDINDPEATMGEALAVLADFFQNDADKMITAAQEFYEGANNIMEQTMGYGLDAKDSSKNMTDSITSTASEETMGVVAGYLSALRQDVGVKRILLTGFMNESWPSYIELVTTANQSLTAVDRNTEQIMTMMRDGQGALYERVERMSRRLDNFANGIDRMHTA